MCVSVCEREREREVSERHRRTDRATGMLSTAVCLLDSFIRDATGLLRK